MVKLTDMQQRIYDYVASCVRDQGYPPSVREIGAAVGLKSPSTVHFHLKRMEELGAIDKSSGKGRAIRLLALGSGQKEQKTPSGRVPIVGDVAAGSPILAQEMIDDYLVFDTGGREEESFALRVRGESMLNAGILPGDLVVVRRQQTASSGEIVVALIGEEATVKRLSLRDGEVWLMPENENYEPIPGNEAQILGKVTAVVRRYG